MSDTVKQTFTFSFQKRTSFQLNNKKNTNITAFQTTKKSITFQITMN